MSCPTVPALEAMLKGPVEAFREMEAHVEKCDECLTMLESLAGHSTVLHDLRVGSSILSETTSTTVSEEITTQNWKPAQIEPIATLSELPRQLDRYEVRSLLGEGGMGQVYLAWDPQLKRQVAIKILRVDPDERPEWSARFRQEVEVIASLQHPQIIEVYDMCFQADRPYFVMEYLEGGSLSDRLSRQLLSLPDACLLIRQLALAIDAAHQHGIIHRDLKPSNILFSTLPPSNHPAATTAGCVHECQPKISDFGLAKRLEHDTSHSLETKSGLILGTPGYMAPEQSLSKARVIAPTLDVYSLGAIFYECLTGRPPFKGASVFETLHQSLYEDPLPPRRLRQELSPDLQAVCLKCLNRIPEQRYASGKKLAEDIDRYLAGQPTLARPVSTMQRAAKWCRRSPVVAGLLAMLIVLILGTLALMAWYTVQLNTTLQDKIAEERRATQAQTKADEGYRLARGTIMTILKRAKESPHAAIPQLLELERTQYEDALGFFRQAIQNDKLADPRLRIELAEAITLLAGCNTQVNRVDDAVAGYREAAAIYEELLQNDRKSRLLQYQKAFCLGQIGYLLLWNRPVDAEPFIKESASQLEALVNSQAEPDTQTWFRLAHSHHNWGMLCRRGNRLDEAKEHYLRSIQINQQHPHLPQQTQQKNMMADSWVGLGLVAWSKKQWQESAEAYSRSHQLLIGLLKENPRNLDAAAALGALSINHGLLDQDRNDPEAALGHFSEAIATLEAARAHEPNFIRLKTALYNAYAARASLHRKHSRFREAAGDIEHCLPYGQPSRLAELWQCLAEDRLKADEPGLAVQALSKLGELDATRFQEFIRNNDTPALTQRADFQQLLQKTADKPIPK